MFSNILEKHCVDVLMFGRFLETKIAIRCGALLTAKRSGGNMIGWTCTGQGQLAAIDGAMNSAPKKRKLKEKI